MPNIKRISFIIPFFNGERYIVECLDSIYAQKLSEVEFEVLIIDDCSSDKQSVEVVQSYAKSHANIRLIRNERNLRVGASRNHGIREAVGYYIWFVDQDDKIESDCACFLLDKLEKGQLDYLTFDFVDFDDLSKGVPHQLVTNDTDVMSGLEYAYNICNKRIWNNQWDTNVWHQIYRRGFLLEHNIFFTEVSYYDDMVVALKSLMYAKQMQAISTPYYHYRFNEQSVIHTEVGISGRAIFDASITASAVLLDLSQEIKEVDVYFSNYFLEGIPYRANSFTKVLLRIPHKQQQKFYKYVHKHSDLVERVKPYLTWFNKVLVANFWIVFILRPIDSLYRRIR